MRDNWVSNTVILAFANHQRHDESRHTGVYVHYRTACKVNSTHLLQESAAPHPMSHGKVGHNHPQYYKYHISFKLDTLGKGSENKRRRNERKHTLEHHPSISRYAAALYAVNRYAVQETFVESAYQRAQRVARFGESRAESPAVPENHPKKTDYAHYEQSLHYKAQYVLLSYQPAVKKGNAGNRHQKHENRRRYYPRRVAGVEHRSTIGGIRAHRYHTKKGCQHQSFQTCLVS